MWSTAPRKVFNFAYFHRRRILAASAFTGAYGIASYKAIGHPNELFRMGIAGSVAHITVECMFHFVDTVNV